MWEANPSGGCNLPDLEAVWRLMKLRPLTVPLLAMAAVAAGSAYLATKSIAGRCFYGEGWCTSRYRPTR